MVWEPEQGEEQWSDREAWRGELHNGGFEAWRGDTSADTVECWDPRDAAEMATWDDSTEGEEEMEGWPEDLAGPEYWMYKRLTD